MPGDKCILQLRGLPPFLSPKYDLKKHQNYKYTAEFDKKKNEQIRFGVLCGTIVIIPAEAREALEQAIGMSGKVTFSRIGNLSETDYLKVTAV